jgi:hypothetical protein
MGILACISAWALQGFLPACQAQLIHVQKWVTITFLHVMQLAKDSSVDLITLD